MRSNTENEESDQVEKHKDDAMNGASSNKKSFIEQIDKLVAVVIYSEGSEISVS